MVKNPARKKLFLLFFFLKKMQAQSSISPAWANLEKHFHQVKDLHMRTLFEKDPSRFENFSLQFEDILLDYSKNRITKETMQLLIALAEEANLPAKIEAMYRGDKINVTEDRAVLHIALRNRANTPILVDGADVMPLVNAVLGKMRAFVTEVRNGTRLGLAEAYTMISSGF